MKKTLSRMLIGFVGGGVIGNLMVLLTSDESGVFCSRLLLFIRIDRRGRNGRHVAL